MAFRDWGGHRRRARWPRPQDTPKDQWLGQYALPLPQSVAAASTESTGALRTAITTWAYGDVAEVLHLGPYNAEQPDIERLLHFINVQGYQVVGEHEEEYVKGPGMMFSGDPEQYLTIIRLRVEKASGTSGELKLQLPEPGVPPPPSTVRATPTGSE
jgi:hypothetical protein